MLIGLIVLMQPPYAAGQAVTPKLNSGDVLDPSDPPDTKYDLAPGLRFGATFELAGEGSRDRDLDETSDDRLRVLEPEVEMAFSYAPVANFLGFVNLEATREYALREPEKEERRTKLALDQAYVLLKGLQGERLALQLGRQKFKDERRWLFDENLDGLRVFYRFPNLMLEASASRLNWMRRDLLHPDERDRTYNYLIYAKSALSKEAILGAYALRQHDRNRVALRESPVFLGIHSSGDVGENFEYWLDFAQVRGRHGAQKIRGLGGDVGGTYEFGLPLEPSLTLGYAASSGDADPDDGIDRNFRQTGLQDNEGRYNGVAKFQYYGEAFDPELSNLKILTGAIGIRPSKRTSVDLVYHRYTQHKAAASLRDSALDADPTGLSRRLGKEVDLVFGYRQREGRRASGLLTLGYFQPGPAFAREAKKAFFARFEIKFEF